MSDLKEARTAVLNTLQPGDIVVASGPHMLRTVFFVTENPHGMGHGLCDISGEVSFSDGKLCFIRVGGHASLDLLSDQEELRILRSGEGTVCPPLDEPAVPNPPSPQDEPNTLNGLSAEEAGRAGRQEYFRLTNQKDPKGSQ